MADDVIETLAKLKPAAADRDAILFAAGRASARRSPIWKWISAGLVVSHLVLLFVWRTNEQPTSPLEVERLRDLPADSQPAPAEVPSIPYDRNASLLNHNPPMPESVPTSSVVPEQHWTARTNPSDLRLD